MGMTILFATLFVMLMIGDHASHFSYIHTHGHIVNAAKLGRQQ